MPMIISLFVLLLSSLARAQINWPGADLQDNAKASCGRLYQEGVKYGGEILMTTSNVSTPILCMGECGKHKGCTTWSWHMAHTCTLIMDKSSNDTLPGGWVSGERPCPVSEKIFNLNEKGELGCQVKSDCPSAYTDILDKSIFYNVDFVCTVDKCHEDRGCKNQLDTLCDADGCLPKLSQKCVFFGTTSLSSSGTIVQSKLRPKEVSTGCPNLRPCRSLNRRSGRTRCCRLLGLGYGGRVPACPRFGPACL